MPDYFVPKDQPKADNLDVVEMPDGTTRYLFTFVDPDNYSQSVDVTEFVYPIATGVVSGTGTPGAFALGLYMPEQNWTRHQGRG